MTRLSDPLERAVERHHVADLDLCLDVLARHAQIDIKIGYLGRFDLVGREDVGRLGRQLQRAAQDRPVTRVQPGRAARGGPAHRTHRRSAGG